jgi:hypothetical protein
MSAAGTLLGIFVKPKATFGALSAKPRILVPILCLVVFQLVFGLILAQTGVIESDTVAKLEAKGAPQEQIDAVSTALGGPLKYVAVVSGPIALVFVLLLSGGLLYFMANLMLGARLRYAHYLSVAAYGGIVGIVDQAVRLALSMNKGTLNVSLGIGAFLGDDLSVPLRMLDTITDPLLLWATGIEALGVAVIAKKGFGFGLLAVLPGLVLAIALSAFRG